MKKYMKSMVKNYVVKNLAALGYVGSDDESSEMLKRNSYSLLNVSPRAF